MFCSACGVSTPDGARFCSSCGAKLVADGAVPAQAGVLPREAVAPLPGWRRALWPQVDTAKAAENAARQGFWAVVICAGMTMTFALLSLANLDSSALVDAVLFAVIAFGIWKMSRIAAVCGLLLYILERVYMWSTVGMTNPIVPALLTVAFITGVRGSFAWRRLRAQQLSIPKL